MTTQREKRIQEYLKKIKEEEIRLARAEQELEEYLAQYPMTGNPSSLPRSVVVKRRELKEQVRLTRIYINDYKKAINMIKEDSETDRELNTKSWKDAYSKTSKNYADELMAFNGNILKISIPQGKTLPNEFTVELSLRSTLTVPYDNMHKWIGENIKDINTFVRKVLSETFGAQIKAFKCFDVVHTRNSVLKYSFEIKPELIKKIEEAL